MSSLAMTQQRATSAAPKFTTSTVAARLGHPEGRQMARRDRNSPGSNPPYRQCPLSHLAISQSTDLLFRGAAARRGFRRPPKVSYWLNLAIL
eukprot:scaffold146256_cov12-Prasinocladus_malaysianus.AAC.1